MSISNLENKIILARKLLSSKKLTALISEKDFALSLSISSLESHIEDLQFQLKTAKEKREKEVIEFRLIGQDVDNGTVPLDVLASISKSFSGLISSASARIKNGGDNLGAIPFDVVNTLNLRFADIGKGSSRLYVTGDTSPDLFGESLLESSLGGLFELLNSNLDSGLSDQVHYLGLRSAHNLSEFLKVLRKKHIELELSWVAPNQEKHFWKGSQYKIGTLEKLLDGFMSSDPENAVLVGVVDLISSSGKLDLKTPDDEIIKITYSKKLFKEVRRLRLGDSVRLDTLETTIYNQATEEEKKKYSLEKILWDE